MIVLALIFVSTALPTVPHKLHVDNYIYTKYYGKKIFIK
jgi:hypothetical protein